MPTSRFNLVLILVFCVTMPMAVVLSTHLARRSFERVKLRDQTITVKGYAERRITSDQATWFASIAAQDAELKTAFAKVEAGRERLLALLGELKVPERSYSLAAADYWPLRRRDEHGNETNQVEGYRVSQSIHVELQDVALARRVSSAAGELIREGIEISSASPQYHYTGMDEMKLQMLGEASGNARRRAELLVDGSGGRLGALKSASQGVFQITAPLSTNVSDGGISDTSTVDKVIKAVVTMEFAIE